MGVAEVRSSFEEYVQARTPALLRIAYLVTGNAHDAEDLVQAALERAATRWQHLTDPEAYLRRVIYTKSISWWRSRRVRPPETLTATLPERPVEADHDTRLAVLSALHRLTRKQRAVLVLRYYEDLDDSTIAAILDCSPVTVRTHAMRAIDMLRRHFETER